MKRSVPKPRVFIGSSTEGLDVARHVKELLSPGADCFIWNENLSGYNKSYFETLLELPNLFDFAVEIATSDDKQESRKKVFKSPRDNVIFEFGLFLGRLNRNRVFILQEKGTKLPTDLMGVHMPVFQRSKRIEPHTTLKETCDLVLKKIKETSGTFEYTLLPSTALAQGYFDNFIYLVCSELSNSRKLRVAKKTFQNYILYIIVPDDLPEDFHEKVAAFTK